MVTFEARGSNGKEAPGVLGKREKGDSSDFYLNLESTIGIYHLSKKYFLGTLKSWFYNRKTGVQLFFFTTDPIK